LGSVAFLLNEPLLAGLSILRKVVWTAAAIHEKLGLGNRFNGQGCLQICDFLRMRKCHFNKKHQSLGFVLGYINVLEVIFYNITARSQIMQKKIKLPL
jgi:hypothetical protein